MTEQLSIFEEKLSGAERDVLRRIMGHGFDKPLPLDSLRTSLGMSERNIKGAVERMREIGLPVGARRGDPHGYYWAVSADELEAAAKPMLNQAFKMLKGARLLIGKHRVSTLLGQLQIELEREA